jgi:hypothetical protein
MPVSDLLQRLRPVGAPGAVGPVAVPVHADDVLAAELAPLFDALEPVLTECDAKYSDTSTPSRAAGKREGERGEQLLQPRVADDGGEPTSSVPRLVLPRQKRTR